MLSRVIGILPLTNQSTVPQLCKLKSLLKVLLHITGQAAITVELMEIMTEVSNVNEETDLHLQCITEKTQGEQNLTIELDPEKSE